MNTVLSMPVIDHVLSENDILLTGITQRISLQCLMSHFDLMLFLRALF